jgi:hypothetical protein
MRTPWIFVLTFLIFEALSSDAHNKLQPSNSFTRTISDMAEESNPKMEDVEDVEEVEEVEGQDPPQQKEGAVAVGGSSSSTGVAIGAGSGLSFMMGLAALVVASLAFKMAKDNERAINTMVNTNDGNSCITGTFTTSSLWDQPILGPDGNTVTLEEAVALVGSRFPFSGDVYDVPEGEVIGSDIELCTFLGDNIWQCQVRHMCTRTNASYLLSYGHIVFILCSHYLIAASFYRPFQGTYIDVFGCQGQLSYYGFFDISTFTGAFAISGGTGDFDGATGVITDGVAADAPEGWFNREINYS